MAEQTQIVMEGGPHQPYHLVEPSPWPILGAFAAGAAAVGMVFFMHYGTTWLLVLGLLGVATVMAAWWRDVIKESVEEKAHSPIVKIGLRYGMMLFICSEVMFFVAFFWAFFNAALFPRELVDGNYALYVPGLSHGAWPPINIETVDPFNLPFLMTLILLLSGTTVTWAHHALIDGHQKDAEQALGLSVLLGVLFLGVQVYEYSHAHFGFTDGIYPSTFFMATGFHGFHVFVGTAFLAVCWWRTAKGHFSPESHFGFEAAAWYWHFVDVVWLFLFVAVYWWGAGTGGGH